MSRISVGSGHEVAQNNISGRRGFLVQSNLLFRCIPFHNRSFHLRKHCKRPTLLKFTLLSVVATSVDVSSVDHFKELLLKLAI